MFLPSSSYTRLSLSPINGSSVQNRAFRFRILPLTTLANYKSNDNYLRQLELNQPQVGMKVETIDGKDWGLIANIKRDSSGFILSISYRSGFDSKIKSAHPTQLKYSSDQFSSNKNYNTQPQFGLGNATPYVQMVMESKFKLLSKKEFIDAIFEEEQVNEFLYLNCPWKWWISANTSLNLSYQQAKLVKLLENFFKFKVNEFAVLLDSDSGWEQLMHVIRNSGKKINSIKLIPFEDSKFELHCEEYSYDERKFFYIKDSDNNAFCVTKVDITNMPNLY